MDHHNVEIREPTRAEQVWVIEQSRALGGPVVVSDGRAHDLREHPTRVAIKNGEPAGLVIYRPSDPDWEILAIKSSEKGGGVGTALLDHVEQHARNETAEHLVVWTTNDNQDALRFYRKWGFRVRRYQSDGFREVLRIKDIDPDTQIMGNYGIAIRDMIELIKPVADC